MDRSRKHYSYFSKALSASVRMPADWDTVTSEDFPLALLAPEKNGFRANVGFNLYKLSGDDEQKFEKAIRSSKQVLIDEYKEYKLIEEQQVWIDGFPAYHQEYTWKDDEMDLYYYQTLTLIYVMPNRLYEVTGTSLLTNKENYLDKIIKIVDSFRFIRDED